MARPPLVRPTAAKPHLDIQPGRNISGVLTVPGDKSISHRYAMLAAIAQGPTELNNYSSGQDCVSTLSCLQVLGCDWKRISGRENAIRIEGRGPELRAPARALDCGNSGSTMRMLSGIVAGQQFASQLIGDESLSQRPMARIIHPLTQMGARIWSADELPPLAIQGGKLKAIDYAMPVASAQVKSSILFAGLFANGVTEVAEPVRTRDHGELALRAFGAEVRQEGNRASIRGAQPLHGIEAHIPGDISAAAFFIAAAALFPGSQLTINDLLMNPTRARLLDFFGLLGTQISVLAVQQRHGELVGTLRVGGRALKGATVAGSDSAALIDELPVIAAIAPYTRDGVSISDASELRVKESDRIAVVAENLRAMGATVDERPDGLVIKGGQCLYGAQIDPHGDHRIAMAFAVAALRAQGETRIVNAAAADISYPGFFRDLNSIVER